MSIDRDELRRTLDAAYWEDGDSWRNIADAAIAYFAEHGPQAEPEWPLLEGVPTKAHIGKRVELRDGDCLHRGVISVVSQHSVWLTDGSVYRPTGTWRIHPDDVTDPQAERIERAARALWESQRYVDSVAWEDAHPEAQRDIRRDAASILAAADEEPS